jgi:hypothetical protein
LNKSSKNAGKSTKADYNEELGLFNTPEITEKVGNLAAWPEGSEMSLN